MDIGTWLADLGLGQYEAAFRENAIDADVLPELTERHLSEMGVALGHRLKILRAIRELGRESVKPLEAADRRQLTVMFCDLVGSTALTAQLDPEDMGDLIRAFQGAITTTMARFDGHIAKYLGDGATVYFGYPRAHEDDAARAARASLALIDAIGKIGREHGVTLQVRLGISTGLVVVGELFGEGEARERGVVGDTPNLAARLMATAEPDTAVVSASTRRLLGRAFELKPLGLQELRGFKAPVPAWTILRENEAVSRFDAARAEAMTPLIGREHEIALLLDRWRLACEGDGQVALLAGEAGIGKSRILAELRERLGESGQFALRYQCSPHQINDAFHPVVGQIWQAAQFVSGEAPAMRLEKLETMIETTGLSGREIAPYLAALLAIPTESLYPPLEMPPDELRERTITALIGLVVEIAKHSPVLMLVEDAHWIDPTSFDMLGRIVERVQDLPILIVVTARPEFTAPWTGRAHVTSLMLNRFGRNQAATMIERITSGKALPGEVLEQIVAKTDGVPLFVEELTKSVIESGLLREENGDYVLASTLTPLAIPSTLHDSLTARLDRLSPIKEIAQIGAAIGREFSHSLLEAVAPIKGHELQDALRQLIEAELIHQTGQPPMVHYVFKHALVQDAAYVSLLRGRRQRIHADIAEALKRRFADEEYPPAIIAHHYTEAGLPQPAAQNWLAAAELALSQSAPTEAEHHASAGLALIPRVAEAAGRDALELGLLVARANALVPLKSISAPETFAAMTAAKELLDRGVGTDLQRASILAGLCAATTLMARMQPALELASQIIEVAERQDDPTYRLVAYRMMGTNQYYAGQNREALASLEHGKQYRDPRRQKAMSYRFGWDPSLSILCFEVLVRLSLGLFESAARLSEQIRAEVADHEHTTTVASATFCAGTWPEAMLGDLDALERDSATLSAYCAEKKVEQIRLLANFHHAYAHAMREPIERNIIALRATLDAVRSTGGFVGSSLIISNLAEVSLRAGDLQRAERDLQEGLSFVEQSGEYYWAADLHRLNGQLALRQRKPESAEKCFVRAIDIAKGQGARLLELRAAIDMVRLWRETRPERHPRSLLEPVLANIEGGEDARDVRNARALLGRRA